MGINRISFHGLPECAQVCADFDCPDGGPGDPGDFETCGDCLAEVAAITLTISGLNDETYIWDGLGCIEGDDGCHSYRSKLNGQWPMQSFGDNAFIFRFIDGICSKENHGPLFFETCTRHFSGLPNVVKHRLYLCDLVFRLFCGNDGRVYGTLEAGGAGTVSQDGGPEEDATFIFSCLCFDAVSVGLNVPWQSLCDDGTAPLEVFQTDCESNLIGSPSGSITLHFAPGAAAVVPAGGSSTPIRQLLTTIQEPTPAPPPPPPPPAPDTVASVVFSPAAGNYTQPFGLTMTCATPGAMIHYTTNGFEPTEASPTYAGAIAVLGNVTFKAKAYKAGLAASATVTAAYTIGEPAPGGSNWDLELQGSGIAANQCGACSMLGSAFLLTGVALSSTEPNLFVFDVPPDCGEGRYLRWLLDLTPGQPARVELRLGSFLASGDAEWVLAVFGTGESSSNWLASHDSILPLLAVYGDPYQSCAFTNASVRLRSFAY